jgi:hypothetical protein
MSLVVVMFFVTMYGLIKLYELNIKLNKEGEEYLRINKAIIELYNWYVHNKCTTNMLCRCPLCVATGVTCIKCPWVLYEYTKCTKTNWFNTYMRERPEYFKCATPVMYNKRIAILKQWMEIRGIEIPNKE